MTKLVHSKKASAIQTDIKTFSSGIISISGGSQFIPHSTNVMTSSCTDARERGTKITPQTQQTQVLHGHVSILWCEGLINTLEMLIKSTTSF